MDTISSVPEFWYLVSRVELYELVRERESYKKSKGMERRWGLELHHGPTLNKFAATWKSGESHSNPR